MSNDPSFYEQLKIKEYNHFGLFVHENQSYLGRSVAWLLRAGGMQRLSGLSDEEQQELFSVVIPEYEKVIEKLWKPDHMNYAWLGNHFHEHAGHGHMHLIPRYKTKRDFYGITFVDDRWGKNYAPCSILNPPETILFKIKESIQAELKSL